jgi:hypothetical protein
MRRQFRNCLLSAEQKETREHNAELASAEDAGADVLNAASSAGKGVVAR